MSINEPLQAYSLGNVTFSIRHTDPIRNQFLNRAFGDSSPPVIQSKEVVCFEMSGRASIHGVATAAMQMHANCLIVQGTCLMSPNGQTFLLTSDDTEHLLHLVLGLTYGHQWLIISEFATMIQLQPLALLSFAVPMRLLPNSRACLSDLKINLPAYCFGWWLPIFSEVRGATTFGYCKHFIHLSDQASLPTLSFAEVDTGSFLRTLTMKSNVVSSGFVSAAADLIDNSLRGVLSGGSLADRIQFVQQLSAQSSSIK